MFNIVLVEPEIPPNTGNIIRLCANCGARLHLIKPLGFDLRDKNLRRAGLDYHDLANIKIYDNYENFLQQGNWNRRFACSTKGSQNYNNISYQPWDTFIFGPETRGLSAALLQSFEKDAVIRIPMLSGNRSLNLSNACSIIVYEAWRQLGFTSA